MPIYEVEYKHLVENIYIAKVEADSIEEAEKMMECYDIISEDLIEEQGLSIEILDITETED